VRLPTTREATTSQAWDRCQVAISHIPLMQTTHLAPRRLLAATVVLAASLTGLYCSALTPQDAFKAENDAAMDRMMAAMDVKPSGDIDRDFAAMMIPHHQGAIDMALAQLRYGHNEQLRRIAQEIIVEQQQEIAAMKLALGEAPPAPAQAPTQVGAAPEAHPAPQAAADAQTAHHHSH